jgi:hypothetical protein
MSIDAKNANELNELAIKLAKAIGDTYADNIALYNNPKAKRIAKILDGALDCAYKLMILCKEYTNDCEDNQHNEQEE